MRGTSVYLIWEHPIRGGVTPRVWYVGITTNTASRERQHRRDERFAHLVNDDTFRMTPILTGLTRDEARVREQALMMAFATHGAANVIYSIAEYRWSERDRWEREIQRLITLLSDIP